MQIQTYITTCQPQLRDRVAIERPVTELPIGKLVCTVVISAFFLWSKISKKFVLIEKMKIKAQLSRFNAK